MVPTRNGKVNQSQKASTIPPLDQLKVYSNQDILICGNCREMFSDLHDLLDHKKSYCKLRFTCKCDSNKSKSPDEPSSASLLCVQCKDAFPNAWDLMVHAQAAHMLNIYELGVAAMANCSSPPLSPRDNNTPDKDSREKTTEDSENGDDHDFQENGRTDTGTPDSVNSRNDKELEDLMDVENTAKTCIMHALSIRQYSTSSTPASQPGSSPPPLAAIAPHTENGDGWKPQNHATKLHEQPY